MRYLLIATVISFVGGVAYFQLGERDNNYSSSDVEVEGSFSEEAVAQNDSGEFVESESFPSANVVADISENSSQNSRYIAQEGNEITSEIEADAQRALAIGMISEDDVPEYKAQLGVYAEDRALKFQQEMTEDLNDQEYSASYTVETDVEVDESYEEQAF